MPKVLMAVYDPAQPSNDGSFWVWRAPGLNLSLLDTFYYDIASQFHPEDPNQLAENDIWGGAAKHQNWFCVWRFLNGGRDQRGRPGRFILTAAFIQASDVSDSDVSLLFENKMFQWIAQQAPNHCPIPQPPTLEEEIEFPSMRPDLVEVSRVLTDKRVEFRGSDALQTANLTGIGLPSDWQWICSIQKIAGEAVAILQTQKKKTPPPPPPPPPIENNETLAGTQKNEKKGGQTIDIPIASGKPWITSFRRHSKKTVVLILGCIFLVWSVRPKDESPQQPHIVNPNIAQNPNPGFNQTPPGSPGESKATTKQNPDPKKEDKSPSAKDKEKGLESKPKVVTPIDKGFGAKAPGGPSDLPKKPMEPGGGNNSVGKAPFVNPPESYQNSNWFSGFTNGFFAGVVLGVGVVIFLRCFFLKHR